MMANYDECGNEVINFNYVFQNDNLMTNFISQLNKCNSLFEINHYIM